MELLAGAVLFVNGSECAECPRVVVDARLVDPVAFDVAVDSGKVSRQGGGRRAAGRRAAYRGRVRDVSVEGLAAAAIQPAIQLIPKSAGGVTRDLVSLVDKT